MIDWVADHRKHHAHSDEEGDPHSPALVGDGIMGALRGPLARARRLAVRRRRAGRPQRSTPRDLMEDPGHARVSAGASRWFVLLTSRSRSRSATRSAATLVGRAGAAASGAASCASSCCTTSPGASTPCATSSAVGASTSRTTRRNVFWLALPSLGEAWHHNHHAFPRSADHGLRRWELDLVRRPDPHAAASRAGLERRRDQRRTVRRRSSRARRSRRQTPRRRPRRTSPPSRRARGAARGPSGDRARSVTGQTRAGRAPSQIAVISSAAR